MSQPNYDNPDTEVIPGVTVGTLHRHLDFLFSDMEAEMLTKASAPTLANALDAAAKTRRFSSPDTDRIAAEFRKIQFRYFIAAFVAGYKAAKHV